MSTTLYKKVGRRYEPVAEYDVRFDSFREGCHLIICWPGSRLVRMDIEPDAARLLAAAEVAKEAMVKVMMEAAKVRPSRVPLTKKQKAAWDALNEAMKADVGMVRPPIVDIVDAGVKALVEAAKKCG